MGDIKSLVIKCHSILVADARPVGERGEEKYWQGNAFVYFPEGSQDSEVRKGKWPGDAHGQRSKG